ncbi:cytochrome P450 [Flavobacterium ustbae]|uniref:cytochrome P450 n=1 Tax=Flavobacterium ustbae TaxID=2488790 RepID=UPI000F77B7D2|nr:cytochrome P450 [Flavobacterium ustbae]
MTTLFLQSEIKNPYLFYDKMIAKNPVFWDENSKIWAVYSYEYCAEILKNENAHIPKLPFNPNLNRYALEIIDNLARLSNGVQHQITRETTNTLFSYMKNVGVDSILKELINNEINQNQINWVDSVCKKLPILTVLKSFDFNENDCIFILEKIESFTKIMLPQKTEEQIKFINEHAEEFYLKVEKHISTLEFYETLIFKIAEKHNIKKEEIIPIAVSNLIGLCIQSFDAGRGLLSNSLLQILQNKNVKDKTEIEKSVIETLRFDPPIHNTRRIATEDFVIDESLIQKGNAILVVLASANRDAEKFENAPNFDPHRKNNHENLTFGMGGHECLAKYFSIHLTTETLWFLFTNYKTISLLENNIQYEPLINARLPKNIWISIYN